MCMNCWIEYSSPKIFNEKIQKAIELISGVYKYHVTGGNLHVILDDWNLEDEYFDKDTFDRIEAFAESHAQMKAEKECFFFLRSLTLEERASALAFYDELI